jgi:D-alanyl-D-alanine dipeptidase
METESKMLFSDDPSDFVSVKEVVSDAILDIRYYSANNFIGGRVDGYEQEVALLTKEAAAALKKAGEEIIGMLSSGDDYKAESQVDVDCRLCERESVFEYRG